MKNFLAICIGSASGEAAAKWAALTEEQQAARTEEAMIAWSNWSTKYADRVIDHGAPLGKTKLVNAKGIHDIRNLMTGYAIVKAESHAAAAAMFENHPHFMIFPGDGVEVMECLEIPET